MTNLVKINNKDLSIKEFQNQRVITFKDIDEVHERTEGTAKRNFSENRGRFIEGIDYFEVSTKNVPTLESYGFSKFAPNGIIVTESGYLMIVKSLTDDLAWKVQRQLVDSYFRSKQVSGMFSQLSPQTQVLTNLELGLNELKSDLIGTKQEIQDMRDVIKLDTTSWRTDTANLISKIAMNIRSEMFYQDHWL